MTDTEALRLLERAAVALRFYANPRNWKEDDWGVASVVQGAAYGNPTEKARKAKRAIDIFLAGKSIPAAETAEALLARVEAQDADLTEIATTMTEHFDSVDLNDLPVSLTKGIVALLAQGERLREALEGLGRWRPDSGEWHIMNCYVAVEHMSHSRRCTVARAALAPGEEK